jgi:hypothetical protein
MTDAAGKKVLDARKVLIDTAFVGKTIKSVETSCNVWTFHFSDGTQQQIEAEQAINTPYGSIAGIYMQQELSVPMP